MPPFTTMWPSCSTPLTFPGIITLPSSVEPAVVPSIEIVWPPQTRKTMLSSSLELSVVPFRSTVKLLSETWMRSLPALWFASITIVPPSGTASTAAASDG